MESHLRTKLLSLFSLIVLSLANIGCYSLYTPKDQLNAICLVGLIGDSTPVQCNPTVTFASSPYEGGDALVAFIEPGGISDSVVSAAGFSFSGGGFDLKKHFRTLMMNVTVGGLEKIIRDNGRRYTRIYFVTGAADGRRRILEGIHVATRRHNKVDIFIGAHGNAGLILSGYSGINIWGNWDYSQLSYTYASDFINYAQYNMTHLERAKVRAVFNNACYTAVSNPAWAQPSIASSITTAFPNSVTVGTPDINWGALHRDSIAFEAYYQGQSFSNGISLGNYVLNTDLRTRMQRSHLKMGKITAKPCLEGLICVDYSVTAVPFSISPSQLAGSKAMIYSGIYGYPYSTIGPILPPASAPPPRGGGIAEPIAPPGGGVFY